MIRPDAGAAVSHRLWPLLVVVVGVAAGLVIGLVAAETWRLGSLVIGASLLVGSVERLLLPDRAAGLLQVRGKAFDVTVLAVAGAAVVTLALIVPPGR